MYCSCSPSANAHPTSLPAQATPLLATVTPRLKPTTTPTPTAASPSTVNPANRCFAIGTWRGDTKLDRWCNENCPLGLCPSQNCRCGAGGGLSPTGAPVTPFPTTPSSSTRTTASAQQQCRAVGTWAGQPQLDQWCSRTCAQFGCDPQYCSCGPATTSPAYTATSPTPSGGNGKSCYAINGWAGSAQLDQYCDEQCRTGLCPPQYCACGPKPAAQLTTRSPLTLPPSTPPRSASAQPPATAATAQPGQGQCRAVNTWSGVAELDAWCRNQCALGNCPPTYCHCGP